MSEIERCFVPICSDKSTSGKLFITVPVGKIRRKLWCEAVGVRSSTRSHGLFCCEDHFKLEDDAENWMFFKTIGRNIKLKKGVVPHINISKDEMVEVGEQLTESTKKRKLDCFTTLETSAQAQRVKKHLFEDEAANATVSTPTKHVEPHTTQVSSPSGYFVVAVQHCNKGIQVNTCTPTQQFNRRIQMNISAPTKTIGVNTVSSKVQVETSKPELKRMPSPIRRRILSTSSSPGISSQGSNVSSPTSSLTSLTSSSSDYNSSKNAGRKQSTVSLVAQNTRLYLGLPPDTYKLVSILTKFALVEYRDVLITLKKIRLNDAYVRLGLDFELSAAQISRIFTKTIPKLADYLQELIFWPKSEEIKRLLPLPFRARFSAVESIIDCLEIQIEKPASAIKQAMTWSQYKNCNTIKYLISLTPNGMVTFISGGYGGRASYIEICKQSGYFDLLRPNTSVMADRGFKAIDSSLHLQGCKLIRPPSVSVGEKLGKHEVRMNKRIASLRVHVERVMSRLREFAMCDPHAVINHDLLHLMNHILLITCAIVNLQGPLIK